MDHNPDAEVIDEADAPDPTSRLDTAEAYPSAHVAAKAVLERTGWQSGMSDLTVERTVGLILGAALLELERPWREATDAERRRAHHLEEALLDADRRLEHLIGQRDRAQTAYLHVGEVESGQRQRADDLESALRAAEAEREAARDLAVRLEADLAGATELLSMSPGGWLDGWASANPDDLGELHADAAAIVAAARAATQERDR